MKNLILLVLSLSKYFVRMEEHTVDIFYGGSFLNEKYRCEVVYLGGLKHEMVLNISNFVLSGLERSI